MKFNYIKPILNIETDEIALSDRADEIDTKTQVKEQRDVVTSLKKTLEANNIVALAAPEIGFKRRIFVMKFDTEIKTFINPMLVSGDGLQLVEETSVVVPNKRFIRARLAKCTLMYQRPTGQVEHREFIGKAALYAQQMLDALDGILETDIGLEIDTDYDNASIEEKNEVLKMYLESLDLRAQQLTKEIEDNKELSQLSDAVKYMTSVIKGETELDYVKKE